MWIIYFLIKKNFTVGDMSTGRQEAFEIFKRDYTQNSNIEDNKDALKAKYVEAKKLGEYVNKSRTKISKFLCTGAYITYTVSR